MRFATVLIPVMLLLCLILPTGLLAVLEYFLAKLESPWPGRALPILSFLSSLCVSAVLLFNTADLTALPVILIPCWRWPSSISPLWSSAPFTAGPGANTWNRGAWTG